MSGFAFAELVRRIERRWVSELSLEPRPLPPELAALHGTFRGEPATLTARAYAGPRLGYVRFVEVQSRDLDIGNVLGLPRVEFALPVLGIDRVEVGRDTAVVVADLSPMTEDQAERAQQHAVLAQHRASSATLGGLRAARLGARVVLRRRSLRPGGPGPRGRERGGRRRIRHGIRRAAACSTSSRLTRAPAPSR